ncbi:MAG: hypothetical protein HC940_05525 [Acaryochloris sp. SU_5_25]|nr:hypothetical protein [Acaryochloris sp. SU_5_25]
MGILLVTPLLLTLPQMGSILRDRRYELLLSLGLTGLVSGWILTAPSNATLHQFHSEYLTFSLTVWSALRFGLPGATAASFLISMLAILGVRAGVGPFVAFSQNFNNAVLSVQVFMTILMVTALVLAMSETQLRTTERQRTNLARYFSPQLVDELANQANPLGQDRRQTVAVLYADITGFTALLDSMQPEAALQILRDIHTRMEAKIFEHQGTLERYTGEGLIAVFGVPQPGIEDATYALNCAYAMVESLAVYNARRALNNEAPILLGIGIDYGVAVMGSVGTDRNRAFMVAGKVSKIPIHLKNLCTQYQADICLSKALQKAVKRENTAGQKRLEEFEFIGEHRLLGLSDPTSVFCLQSKTSDSYYREEATDI